MNSLRVKWVYSSVIIGVVAFLMTVADVKIGPFFVRVVGRGAELLGNVVLIFIGAKILLDHLG